MSRLANCCYLLKKSALCGVVVFSIGSGLTQGEQLHNNCQVPTGLYQVKQLADHDTLSLAVTSDGTIRGLYRLSDAKQSHLVDIHLDSSAQIKCHENNITIKADNRGYAIDLQLSWDSALARLYVTGNRTGKATWTRYGMRIAVICGAFCGASWVALLTFAVIESENTPFTVCLHTLLNNVVDDPREYWATAKAFFFENKYIYTLPLIATVTGATATYFISGDTTCPATGTGELSITAKKDNVCTIPKGLYQGQAFDPAGNSFMITIPITHNSESSLSPKVLAPSKSAATYDIIPSVQSCLGNEIILEWNISSPATSKGYLVAFYDEEQGLIGTSAFTTTPSGWLRDSSPFLTEPFPLEKKM